MAEQWTKEQRDAVTSRGGNLLVAAAAGAGKTSVLVERIIRRITDPVSPVDVDRLLVVTFTNAAASEMRDRISRALTGALNRYPGSKYLQRQVALLGRAAISTMHSFCLDLLRQYFYRIDLDPAFRVADATEAVLIQTEALEELFESRYADGENLLFTGLVDSYGGRRDDTLLQELVLQAYAFARSTPDPAGWLAKLPDNFNIPRDANPGQDYFDQLPWAEILKIAVAIELAGSRADLEQALRLARRPGGPQPYLANLVDDLSMVAGLTKACAAGSSWSELYQGFQQAAFRKLATCRKELADEDLVEQVKKLRDGVKKKISTLQREYFSRTPAELCADLATVAPLVGEIAALVKDFGETYRQAKATRGVVDFNDLEHYCMQVLSEPGEQGPVPSQAAIELRRRFEEILVDEYQDINDVQETILRLVSRQGEMEPNLFMVGDVKQSIYRFRLAEPGLFLDKYRSYPVLAGGAERRIDLSRNFRSRRGIVDAVNFVFRQLMTPGVGEMAYDADAELIFGANYPESNSSSSDGKACDMSDFSKADSPENVAVKCEPCEFVELHLIESVGFSGSLSTDPAAAGGDQTAGDNGQEHELEEEKDALQQEAGLVADRILELVHGTPGGEPGMLVYDRDSGAYRPLAYRDVVVLLRATSGSANTFVEEFRLKGVPVYAELATGYFEATEVETLLSLLHIIDNPRQDVFLAGVLRSPMVGLRAADLAKVRLAARRGDFYDAVVAAALAGWGELSERLVEFLESLERWRTQARQGTLADLIWSVYRDTGYYDFVGGLPGGSQRQANLRALQHRARQYEATTFRGLFLFLRFIERIREGGRDLGAARALSEKENVVRIMSIHKSKGLEFPVVFLAGLNRKFNFRDLNKDLLFHKDLGLGPQLVDAVARVTYPTAAKLALKHRLKMEALAEEMRILYVAMTRAREKLVLVGSTRNLAQSARKWCGPAGAEGWSLPDGYLGGVRSALEWLATALARHRDGAELRKLGLSEDSSQLEVAGDRSRWKIRLAVHSEPATAEKTIEPEWLARVSRMEPLEPGPLAGVIKARLEWTYPAAGLLGRAAKATVTEIKRRFELAEDGEDALQRDFRPPIGGRPLFMQEERGLSAAEAGTALHLALQHLDLKGALDTAAIRQFIEKMVEREILTAEQAAAIPAAKIANFFAGHLGARLLAGREVLRELPFT
ncbi:MAG: UvrD-helicase domain-containing protein, partial [Desulfotomaculaceae bacterium]|nr:UvrD-helicase domain-containing protein [Desulfotomaculaceae bacterium]